MRVVGPKGERELSRLQATEMRVLRKIAGVTRMDRIRNETGSRISTREGGEKERMLEGEGGVQEGKCGGESDDW